MQDFLAGLKEDFIFTSDEKWPERDTSSPKIEEWVGSNCLAYAFNYKKPIRSDFYVQEDTVENIRKNPFSQLGPKGINFGFERDEILWRFTYNLGILGVNFRIISKDELEWLSNSEKLIAIAYSKKRRDYHFIRRNVDGTWSHKLGWCNQPEILCDAGEDPGEWLEGIYEYEILNFFHIELM